LGQIICNYTDKQSVNIEKSETHSSKNMLKHATTNKDTPKHASMDNTSQLFLCRLVMFKKTQKNYIIVQKSYKKFIIRDDK